MSNIEVKIESENHEVIRSGVIFALSCSGGESVDIIVSGLIIKFEILYDKEVTAGVNYEFINESNTMRVKIYNLYDGRSVHTSGDKHVILGNLGNRPLCLRFIATSFNQNPPIKIEYMLYLEKEKKS